MLRDESGQNSTVDADRPRPTHEGSPPLTHSNAQPSRFASTSAASFSPALDVEGARSQSAAEREFLEAILDYKQNSGRMFPTWSEVLEVAVNLGYVKAGAVGTAAGTAAEPAGEVVTVLHPDEAKGLEFDAVVVIEPAALVDGDAVAGGRMLYIALTRAVQELVILHDRPLPVLLAEALHDA